MHASLLADKSKKMVECLIFEKIEKILGGTSKRK